MQAFKNKKAEEGAVGTTGSWLIALIIIALLILFAAMWYSGLGNKAIQLIKSALRF